MEPIRADYRAWQAKSEACVRERRGSLVVGTTPADPAKFAAEARTFRRAGYRVELLVPAVRAADSRGTAHRYARLSARGLPTRFATAPATTPTTWCCSPPSRPPRNWRPSTRSP